MANKSLTDTEILSHIDKSFDDLDNLRMEALQTTKNLLVQKHQILQREKERLEKKYGPQYARLEKIEARLLYDEQMLKALDIEIRHSAQKVQGPPDTAWRVHGLVTDVRGDRLKEVTVLFSDEKGQRIRDLPQSVTDEQGYYVLTLEREQVAKVKDAELFLSVVQKRRQNLFMDPLPLKAELGILHYKDILVPDLSPQTPPSNEEEPPITRTKRRK